MKIFNIIFLCFISCCFQVTGTSLIKYVLNESPIVTARDYIPFLLHLKVILAFSFVFVAAMIMSKALSIGSLSLVTPVFTAINFVFTVLVGRLLFNDSMSLSKVSGLIIIIVGVVLVANSEK